MYEIGGSATPWRAVALAAILSMHVILGGGCSDGQPPPEPEEPTRDEGLFGDPYQIVTNRYSALPDDQPALTADTLGVSVSYTGGCNDHRFDIEFESGHDTTRVWLRHRNPGDTCEEDVFDRLNFELPDEALETGTILMLNPNHDEPFILRWGTPSPFDTMDASQSDG